MGLGASQAFLQTSNLSLTQEGNDLKGKLQILLWVHLGVAISKLIILGIMFGLGDLIQCMILWCAIRQHDFCNTFIYMLVCMLVRLQLLVPALFAVQTGKPLNQAYQSIIKNINSTFVLIYMLLLVAFYSCAVFFAYKAYREFKYCR